MKQAIGWYYEALFYLGLLAVGWVVLIVVVSIASSKLKTMQRTLVIALTMLSFPGYVAFRIWYPGWAMKRNMEQRRVIANEQSELYRKLCATKPPLNVKRVIAQGEPVDVRIDEPDELYGLDITMPRAPDKIVCWLDKASTKCSSSNVRYIEQSHQNRLDCRPPSPPEKCKVERFRYDRGGTYHHIPVERFTARYVLSVSTGEELGPLINKYYLSLTDAKTGELLANTYLFRKSWDGFIGLTALIAEMLGKVFPMPTQQTDVH